jgi:hypothetical protein
MSYEKIWRVVSKIPLYDLEHKLNQVAEEGYQIYKIDKMVGSNYNIIAFDPAQLGKLMASSMVKPLLDKG